jgi:beta-glucosidase
MTTEDRQSGSERSFLPEDFVWGVATAAYQIEGGVTEGGRGRSIWDTFSHTPGKTFHGDTGDIACDHYHRWASDLDLMAELGIPAYRLSLSWSRLQPGGTGPLNPEGVTFYRNLLQGAVDRGITPYVTLYHWDLPQELQDAGGWPERGTAYRFGDYASLVADALGDLAEQWITINEPICASFLSYSLGMQAPGLTDTGLAVRAAHHLLLAHGLALRAFRDRRPSARVGITNLIGNLTPVTDSAADVAAVRDWDARSNRLFLDPVYLGQYSAAVVETLGEYGITAEAVADGLVRPGDLELICARTDFAGVNHYTNMVVRADPAAANGISWEHVTPAPTPFGWSDTPVALTAVLLRVAEISGLPLYVTESGASFHDYLTPDGLVHDPERIAYFDGYTRAVGRAVGAGADVRGYFAWSFLDNFEWAEGYSKRFGLVYVDYRTQDRIPKDSARWYSDLIAAHSTRAAAAPSTTRRLTPVPPLSALAPTPVA